MWNKSTKFKRDFKRKYKYKKDREDYLIWRNLTCLGFIIQELMKK